MYQRCLGSGKHFTFTAQLRNPSMKMHEASGSLAVSNTVMSCDQEPECTGVTTGFAVQPRLTGPAKALSFTVELATVTGGTVRCIAQLEGPSPTPFQVFAGISGTGVSAASAPPVVVATAGQIFSVHFSEGIQPGVAYDVYCANLDNAITKGISVVTINDQGFNCPYHVDNCVKCIQAGCSYNLATRNCTLVSACTGMCATGDSQKCSSYGPGYPTVGTVTDITLERDALFYDVQITGITSGGQPANLVLTASSSNSVVVSQPSVTYRSPDLLGALTLKIVGNVGQALITVQVTANYINGQPTKTATTTFRVVVRDVEGSITVGGSPTDCALGWPQDFGLCSAACVATMTAYVKVPASNGGRACPVPLPTIRAPCNDGLCITVSSSGSGGVILPRLCDLPSVVGGDWAGPLGCASGSSVPAGTVCTFQSHPGYVCMATGSRTCENTGTWDEIPSCVFDVAEANACPLSLVLGGTWIGQIECNAPSGSTVPSGTVCTFAADQGYTCHGDGPRVCMSGAWDYVPYCVPDAPLLPDCLLPNVTGGTWTGAQGCSSGAVSTGTACFLQALPGYSCTTVGAEVCFGTSLTTATKCYPIGGGLAMSLSCQGYCDGMAPSGCSCIPGCELAGTCCADKALHCPESTSSAGAGSCAGQCGYQGIGGPCHCDDGCEILDDCCVDYCVECGSNREYCLTRGQMSGAATNTVIASAFTITAPSQTCESRCGFRNRSPSAVPKYNSPNNPYTEYLSFINGVALGSRVGVASRRSFFDEEVTSDGQSNENVTGGRRLLAGDSSSPSSFFKGPTGKAEYRYVKDVAVPGTSEFIPAEEDADFVQNHDGERWTTFVKAEEENENGYSASQHFYAATYEPAEPNFPAAYPASFASSLPSSVSYKPTTSADSLAARLGETAELPDTCQCDVDCIVFEDCCQDYPKFC